MQFFNQGSSIGVYDQGSSLEIDVHVDGGWTTAYIDKDLILQLAEMIKEQDEPEPEVSERIDAMTALERMIRG